MPHGNQSKLSRQSQNRSLIRWFQSPCGSADSL